tara:strand:+ start:359 stop:529 length:171 start_codon:yes stop_codon:yes gene_type:complete
VDNMDMTIVKLMIEHTELRLALEAVITVADNKGCDAEQLDIINKAEKLLEGLEHNG